MTHSVILWRSAHSFIFWSDQNVTSRKNTHLSPSVTIQAGSGWVFIVISVANLIHWSGLVVLCCCFAWWQWSSFIHDTDYCDNLNTELLIGHMCTMKASDWWSRSHLHFPHTPRDTELPWYDSLCHDQKSEENLLKRYGQRIDKILLFMDTLCSYLCTSPMMQWWWAFLFAWIEVWWCSLAPLQNRSRNCLIFL